MTARWPKPLSETERAHFGLDEAVDRFVHAKYELVGKGRDLRRQFNIPSNKKVRFVLKPAGALEPREAEVLKNLLGAETVEINPAYSAPKTTASALSPIGELFLPLDAADLAAEKGRLTKELAKTGAEIEKLAQKLNNAAFVAKAPAQILTEARQRLAEWQARREHVANALHALEQL